MKTVAKKRFAFIGKSVLWSLLLYAVMMLVFNWDDVSNTLRGRNTITIVTGSQQGTQTPFVNDPTILPANISADAGVIKSIVILLKTITGVSGKITGL